MDAERGKEAAEEARDTAEEARDTAEDAVEGVNQGATGNRPLGESPLSATTTDNDLFDERPEAFVGAAFAGGLVVALILRKIAQ
jgi:ElaB/YqjD/DUF883 family membrane-anchored ribosome-binding protein